MFSKTQKTIMLALMSAILVIAQVSLAVIPNVELVSLLVIVYTLHVRKKVFYIIYMFVLIEGAIFGFGSWWVSYLYIWSLLAVAVLMLKENKFTVVWALVSGVFGLAFGLLCGVPYLFAGGFSTFVSYWISGIPFDIIHCIGNFLCTLILFKPLSKAMCFIKVGDLFNLEKKA